MKRVADLSLGVVGKGTFCALIDGRGSVSWACLPGFDGDPAFCSLLAPRGGGGEWAIEVEDIASVRQFYVPNTAVLRTVIEDARGGAVELTDFAPRWRHHDRF